MTRANRYIWMLLLGLTTGVIQAQPGVVVIPLMGDDAQNLKNVITVAKANGDFTSPIAAINSIPTTGSDVPGPTNRYLIVIGPGEYDIGSESLEMREWVSIQGSGRESTKIFGAVNTIDVVSQIVMGASNAALTDMTLESKGGGEGAYAIYAYGSSPRIERINAYASGGAIMNIGVGVYNGASPVIMDVIATATGNSGSGAAGLMISRSAPRVSNVIATGRNGGPANYGVEVYQPPLSGILVMNDIKATAEGGGDLSGDTIGMYFREAGSPVIANLFALGTSGATANYGVYIIDSSPFIKESLLSGTTAGLWFDGNSKSTKVVNSFLGSVSDGALNTQQCRETYNASLADVNC